MASTYTDSLGLEKQGDGENANTWGLRLNQSVIDLVDEAVAGYVAVALTSGTQTDLTVTDGSSSTGRHASLEFTGNIAATVTVTLPAQQKTYAVINSVTNGGDILIRNTGAAASTGQTIKSGKTALLASNGSLIKKIGGEEFDSGTKMIFQQTAAPTGWTKDTSNNDKALRITSGSVGTGGSVAFETAFASQTPAGSLSINTPTVSGTVGGTALTAAQLPSHFHFTVNSDADSTPVQSTESVTFESASGLGNNDYKLGGTTSTPDRGKSSSTGSGDTHTHSWSGTVSSISGSFSGSAMNLDVQYVDVIICTKD